MTKTDEVAGRLNAAIASGEYAHGSALPSERELMEQFGVSRVTVRAALKKVGSTGTIRRIHGKGSFVNNDRGGTKRLGTSTVHFVAEVHAAAGQQDMLALTLCSELSNLLAKTGRGLRLYSARAGENCAKTLLDSCGAEGLSGGVIAYSALMDDEGLALLKANGVPCVTLGRPPAKGRCPYVETDHRMGARLAVSHLIEHGHRRIALFAGPGNFTKAESIRTGYREALDEAGIAFAPSLIYDVPMWDDAAAFAACGNWLDAKTGATAFLSAGGIATIGICRKLAERGLKLPDDLAAVMYTDFPWLRPALPVPFTAVYEYLNSLATNMVGLLDEVRTGAAGNDSARIITPAMVRRRSCGCGAQ